MARKEKNVVFQNETTVMDSTTGEVVQNISSKVIRQETEPEFVKLYISDLALMNGLSERSDLIFVLLKRMNYQNEVVLNSYVRGQICEELSIKPNTLSHAFRKLIEKQLLTKLGANTYLMNPHLFGRGKWEDIKSLRVTYSYTASGRQSNVERNFEEVRENHCLDGIGDEMSLSDLDNLFQNTSKEEFLCAMNMIADKLYNDKPRPKGLQLLD